MSKISLSGNPSGSGTLTIASPNTNSDRTLTLPDTSATLLTTAGGTLTGGLTMGGLLNLGSTGQIQFPATQNPSSNANTLDDYEEGTFTPTIGGLSSAGTGTYVANGQIGRYQKIGNRCYFTIWLQWTDLSGAGGALVVYGLPFASSASTNAYYAITAYMDQAITLNANAVLQAYVITGSTRVFLGQYTSGGSGAAGITLDSNAAIMLTGHYETV